MPLSLTAFLTATGEAILDATRFVRSAKFSTNLHGTQAIDAELERNMVDSFRIYDAPGMLHIEADDGAQTLAAARLEEPGLHAGGAGALKLHALGYWRALTDIPYTALWSTTSVALWRPSTPADFFNSYTERFYFDTRNRIAISPQKNSTQGNAFAGRQVFENPSGGARSIVGLQFAYQLLAPVAWQAGSEQFDANWGFLAAPWTLNATGVLQSGAVHVTFAATQKIGLYLFLNGAPAVYAGETDAAYLHVTNMRIVTSTTNRVNTTLTVNRAAGVNVTATVGSTTGMYVGMQLVINSGSATSEMVTVLSVGSSTQFNATFVNAYVIGNAVQGHQIYADEIVKDLISITSAANTAQLSSSTSGVLSPGRDLADATYADALPSDIITALAVQGTSANGLYEAGVDDQRRVFFRPQGSAAQTWFVDISDLDITRSADGLHNSAYAVYADASNTPARSAVSTNAASVVKYGITRQQAVDVQTTSSTYATGVRDTAIAAAATVQARARYTIRAVYGSNGARHPLGYVRAGDVMTIRNLPPQVSAAVDSIRTFRLSRTEYDMKTGILAIEPEAPNATLDALVGGQL
jgi:hypothetical protein